jgi:hypothetical protein
MTLPLICVFCRNGRHALCTETFRVFGDGSSWTAYCECTHGIGIPEGEDLGDLSDHLLSEAAA